MPSRFLTHPELFPARLAGEPWGEESVTLDLPGGRFRVTGLSRDQALSLSDRFDMGEGRRAKEDGENTASDPQTADREQRISDSANKRISELAIFRAAPSDFVAVDTRGWSYDLDLDGAAIAGMNLMARLGVARSAIWTCATGRDEFWGVVENVLRPLVARRLLAGNGLLVHSSAVVLDGRAFLLAGGSGAGKSTLAAMALQAGHAVMSDDLNAVVGDEIVPLPFSGDLSREVLCATPSPLHAVVALEQGTHDGVRPLSRAQAVSLLVRCAPYVNRDAALGEVLFDRAQAIACGARTAVLTFRRDGDVWPILAAL
jgi:hypothetical protein